MKQKSFAHHVLNPRRSGILVHPTSFPGPYGIGDLGKSAYQFIDFLVQSSQELWQVLPLGPTGYGDSPYQSFSSFAGQPLLISIDGLVDMNLLDSSSLSFQTWNDVAIDFGAVIPYKTALFRQAYEKFKSISDYHDEFNDFCDAETFWLDDYALFMAAKDAHDGDVWTKWPEDLAFYTSKSKKKWRHRLEDTFNYYRFLQFLFFRQWLSLKTYANERNIHIIGDIPIFVAYDSADVWGAKKLFCLDEHGYPTSVAGVPPDYFSATGQLWGNPLYNWDEHHKEKYAWWIARIRDQFKLFDYVRIDHFRGFESYWAVPYGSENAIHGEWLKGPGHSLFDALEKHLGKHLPIIAEDLGLITKPVIKLREHFELPGMKILQFAFENLSNNDFLPFNYEKHCIAYTGTHDNDTSLGWYKKASSESQDKVRRFMNTSGDDIAWDFIRTCFLSPAEMAIVPLQDVLSLDSWARMNRPGIASGNWGWRYKEEDLQPYLSERLGRLVDLSGRGQKNAIDENLETLP